MMNKRSLFFSLIFVLSVWLSPDAQAQFEGQVKMNLYSYENNKTEVSELNLFATSDRIMLKGEQSFDLMDEMSTDGLLIRNDMKDFIVMTGENKALQVTKLEIEGLVNMFSNWGDDSEESTPDKVTTDYSFSDRTKTILGYEAAEMIVKDTENPGKHLSIWLTPEIKINWGMLGERWKNMPKDLDREINGMSQQIIFKDRNFPLMIESVEGNNRTLIMEAKQVNESSIAKAMVEVPSGVVLMSFRDYVFQKMMEQ